MKFLPKNHVFKDPSVLPTIHPLVEFLRGWLILNLENIHSRTTAPTSVNTFVQTPRNCQFLTMLREIRSQTSLNGDHLYLVNHTIAPLIRFSVQTANDDHPINQRAHWSIPMDWTSQASFTFDIFPANICLEDIRVLFGLWQCSDLDFERVPVLKTLWPNRAGKTLIYSPPLNQDPTRLYAFS